MKKIFCLCVMASFIFFTVCTAYGTEYTTEEKVKELFETKCSACHGLKRVTSVQKTSDEWDKTVQRMKAKKNSNITDEEAKIITNYLIKHYGKNK